MIGLDQKLFYDDVEFWTKLIKVKDYFEDEIQKNCTHVIDDIWIFEGDETCLESKFQILAEGAVPALGDLNQQELLYGCNIWFGIDLQAA